MDCMAGAHRRCGIMDLGLAPKRSNQGQACQIHVVRHGHSDGSARIGVLVAAVRAHGAAYRDVSGVVPVAWLRSPCGWPIFMGAA